MNTSDPLKTNLVAGALTSTHFTVRTAMPLLLGVLSSGYGFSDGQLGALGSAYSVGATLVALTSVVWMRGLFLRLPAVLFLLLGLGALASIAFTHGYPLALAMFFLAGIGLGGVYSLMIALLSRTESPNRSFGWQWGVGSLPGVLLLYAIPSFSTLTGGVRPVFELIVAANVLMAFAAIFLPDRLKPAPNAIGPGRLVGFSADVRANVWIALFGLCAFYLGITGGWSFLGRVATESGLSTQYAGTILAIGTATSSTVAFMAGGIGDRGAGRSSMTAVVAAMLVGLTLIVFWPTRFGYGIGTIVFIGLATVLTFGTGIISILDKCGQASGLPAAALGAGSILGPAIAGQLFETEGAGTMLLGCGLSLIAGLAAYVIAYRKASDQ
jgi:predicted MFS family arabinose efflux permease